MVSSECPARPLRAAWPAHMARAWGAWGGLRKFRAMQDDWLGPLPSPGRRRGCMLGAQHARPALPRLRKRPCAPQGSARTARSAGT